MSRRELLVAGAATAAALGLPPARARAQDAAIHATDFRLLPAGANWPGWACPGVANLYRHGGRGVIEAGSDVFPTDPRPVAFALDTRYRDAEIAAVVDSHGAGAGLVLRRSGPRAYVAALYDDELKALVIVRRTPDGVEELARASADGTPSRIYFRAAGEQLVAVLDDRTGVEARDPQPQTGDPGVIATSRTLFPGNGPPVLPALGNLRLLPYGVQEGQAFIATPLGQEIIDAIRERSTASFTEIVVRGTGRRGNTPPSVIAASTITPTRRGALTRIATDVPARVELEYANNPQFRKSRRTKTLFTDGHQALQAEVRGPYWRAHVKRRGRSTTGPTRSYPRRPTTLAIGSCASQFGPVFDLIAARRPDVFVWQGDLNYPDTNGPLAQTTPGYAGLWRDFLANPKLAPILDRTMFAVQRDDHDYGLQDANSTNLLPHGLHPWESLMERRPYYRFRVHTAEVWVLDQRLHKTDPEQPDTPEKTLLGLAQREWLIKTARASKARHRIVCSPCTLAPLPANARDGSWAAGYSAERDLILKQLPPGTVFITGDTHWTMAYERDGLLEIRPCPLGIPTPNDITLTQPNAAEEARRQPGVVYAEDERGHVAFLTVGDDALEIELVREDGAVPYRKRLA